MNQFQIIGHMGADAEVKNLNSGKQVAKLRVAVNPRAYKKDGGEWVNPPAQWFYVDVYMPATVEWAGEKLTRGSKVLIVGSLRPREYTDGSGEVRWAMDLVVNDRGEGHRVIGLDLKEGDQAQDD